MSGEAAAAREPLLLIHGLGGSRTIWEPVIPLLEGEREVIAIDMPGFGSEPPLPDGVEASAANLARALRERHLGEPGLARPHVAGNSLGGWVGLEMGRLGWAASVTALSPAGLWRGPIGERPLIGREWAQRLRPLVSLGLRAEPLRRRAVATFAGRPERVPASAGRELVLGWIDAEGYEAANRAMRRSVFDPAGYPAEVPVTVAWGERDRLVAPPRPERRPAGARFLVMPGVGHTPTWDDPELVAEVLLSGSAGGAPAAAGSGQPVEPGQPTSRRSA
ncbi:MAG: alpha/beta fold hydrolase [Solirubrobacterales bacterium]